MDENNDMVGKISIDVVFPNVSSWNIFLINVFVTLWPATVGYNIRKLFKFFFFGAKNRNWVIIYACAQQYCIVARKFFVE